MADTVARDPAIAGVLKRPFREQVAFFRGKLGNLVPTERWTDMQRSAHDRGFMVAGAQVADLLAGLAASVDRTHSEGIGIDQFRKDFDALVERHGWSYRGERNWRTRVIYTTNMATSYNAGRLAQLREGGFPFWVYVHSDSVIAPRPLHVSWNGVTLPADDPWWKTHFTPNGWGCKCRIVGVRRPEDAARYGRVQRTAPNDGIDAKTGAPAGIDKGWDYMPGDTVSDTVRQMAEKTQQWEYTLAKAYMQALPESVRDALAIAYRALPSVAADTRLYAQRILEGRAQLDVPPYRTLGLATRAQAGEISAITNVDVAGFDFALDAASVRHVREQHGGAPELLRGQRPVTADDYAKLPSVLGQPDRIEDAGASDIGRPMVRFVKEIDGETFVAALEVRTGRRMLALQSFWVKK